MKAVELWCPKCERAVRPKRWSHSRLLLLYLVGWHGIGLILSFLGMISAEALLGLMGTGFLGGLVAAAVLFSRQAARCPICGAANLRPLDDSPEGQYTRR